MDQDYIFLRMVENIRNVIQNPDEYLVIRSTGELRLLLLDGLLARINRNRRHKIRFEVMDCTETPYTRELISHNPIFVLILDTPADSADKPPGLLGPIRQLKIDAFLKANAVYTNGHWVNVHNIITYSANVAGGVHFGDPEVGATQHQQLHEISSISIFGHSVGGLQILPILKIVLSALWPLYEQVKAERIQGTNSASNVGLGLQTLDMETRPVQKGTPSTTAKIFNENLNQSSRSQKTNENMIIFREVRDELDQIGSSLQSASASPETEYRLRVSRALLDAAVKRVNGIGMAANNLRDLGAAANAGTLGLRWRTGERAIDLLLLEYLGGLFDNRVAILLNKDSSFKVRILDDLGQLTIIQSPPYGLNRLAVVVVTWTAGEFELWVQGQRFGPKIVQNPLKQLGPHLLMGIDIDGAYGATALRQGYTIDGDVGINLERNGVWKGNRLSDVFINHRKLLPKEIQHLSNLSFWELRDLKEKLDPAKENTWGTMRREPSA